MKKTNLAILFGTILFSFILVCGTIAAVKAAQIDVSNTGELQNPDAPPPETLYDLGDAPDSTNHAGALMTAYIPGGGPPNTPANYPTVFDPATGLPPGPRHGGGEPPVVYLGPGISLEFDADLPPDNDGVTNIDPKANIPDLDGFDDGVHFPLALPHCVPTTFTYTVNVQPNSGIDDFFVNVWFDWNRNGDWKDTLKCPGSAPAPEWAVQNQLLSLGPGIHVVSTPTFVPNNPQNDPLWMRITISELPAPSDAAGGSPDGRGPENGYSVGETEDYYIPGPPSPDYDIYMKDNPTDDGSVPSSPPNWKSPDIWARSDGDCTITSHQNPEAGVPTTLCVRVRNRLSTPVHKIIVNLYYGSAGLGLGWPGSWAGIGFTTIPSLAGNSEAVKSIPWTPPNITGHFCFLARVDSHEDPIGSGPDTVAPVNLVQNNNNIAQRNFNIVDFPEFILCDEISDTISTNTEYFDIVNTKTTSVTVDIKFDSGGFPLADGEIVVHPGPLWGRWTSLINFNQVGVTLKPNNFPAEMNGVELGPSETVSVTMDVTAPGNVGFEIDVTGYKEDKVFGGITFARVLPSCIYMPVVLDEDAPPP